MTAKPGLEWLTTDAEKYGFVWGDLAVIRAISHREKGSDHPYRVLMVVDARTGNGVDIHISPTGRSVRTFPVKMKPRKETP